MSVRFSNIFNLFPLNISAFLRKLMERITLSLSVVLDFSFLVSFADMRCGIIDNRSECVLGEPSSNTSQVCYIHLTLDKCIDRPLFPTPAMC